MAKPIRPSRTPWSWLDYERLAARLRREKDTRAGSAGVAAPERPPEAGPDTVGPMAAEGGPVHEAPVPQQELHAGGKGDRTEPRPTEPPAPPTNAAAVPAAAPAGPGSEQGLNQPPPPPQVSSSRPEALD